MKYVGKAKEVAEKVINAFQDPDTLPNAITSIFINEVDLNKPSGKWSFTNRLIMFISGTHDARGYKQWIEMGRNVQKGCSSIHIFAPLTKKVNQEDNTENAYMVYGFKAIPVFAVEDTQGDELPSEREVKRVFDALPFVNVAKKWGIKFSVYQGSPSNASAQYLRSRDDSFQMIAMGVENDNVWLHELVHAAENKLKTLTLGDGQQLDNEYVAELGACVLMNILGHKSNTNIKGTYEYLSAYAKRNDVSVEETCFKYLNRVCEAVNLIMCEADTLKEISTNEDI